MALPGTRPFPTDQIVDLIRPQLEAIVNELADRGVTGDGATTTDTPTDTTGDTGGGTGETAPPAAAEQPPAAEAEIPRVQIMSGRDVKWYKVGGMYYASYKLPHSNRRAIFEATGFQMDQVFGRGNRPGAVALSTLQDLTRQDGMHFSGNISEIAGEGSFENAVERGVSLALEGDIPEWMKDSEEIWDILYVAQSEGKSDDWTLKQISGTRAFQDRYVGIKHFEDLGLDLSSSVEAYRQYETGLKRIGARFGTPTGNVTPELVGDLLSKGHSLQDVTFVYDTFDRMQQHEGSFAAFNEILLERGIGSLGPADQFKFLAGQAPPELYKIWEETSILSAAESAGEVDKFIGAQEAIDLARRTPGVTSQEQALEGLQKAARLILQHRGAINLNKFDLDPEDIIDLSLGLAPRSGRTQAEVAQSMQAAVREGEKFLKQKARPYISFTEEGRPKAASLGGAGRRAL